MGSPKTRERSRMPRPHAVPDGRENSTQRFQPCGQGLIAVPPLRASVDDISPKCENTPRLCKSSLGRFRSGCPPRQLLEAPHAPPLSGLAIRPSSQRKPSRIDDAFIPHAARAQREGFARHDIWIQCSQCHQQTFLPKSHELPLLYTPGLRGGGHSCGRQIARRRTLKPCGHCRVCCH